MKKEFMILDTGLTDRTGRRYPEETIKKEVERLEKSGVCRVLGELDIGSTNAISLDKISHEIVDIRFEDGKMFGTVKTYNTPCGMILSELDKAKVPLATAMRGMGKVDENGFVSEYTLISIDIVADPAFKRDD